MARGNHPVTVSSSDVYDRFDNSQTVYCKLFSDMVTPYLCELRKKELNARGVFSCCGCMTTVDSAVTPSGSRVKRAAA